MSLPAEGDTVESGGRALRGWRVSLSFSLVALSVITVASTAGAVHYAWLHVSRQSVAEVVRQLNVEIAGRVDREIQTILDSASAAQLAIRDILRDGVIEIENKPQRDRLFFAVLNANPHFSWVSFGKPNGNFYGVQRRDPVNLRIAESRWDPVQEQATRLEDYFVDDGERISKTVSKIKVDDYYAPERDWYRRAVESPGRTVWTDIYIFAQSRKPGLNTAITLEAPNGGPLLGVVSIAIELERLSHYLASLAALRSGAAFLLDRRGRLLAYRDPDVVTRPGSEADTAELRPLSATDEPRLRIAAEALRREQVDLTTLQGPRELVVDTADGRAYVTLVPSARDGWLIGTVVPELDFMRTIEAEYGRLGLAVLGAVLLFGLLMILIARGLFVRPIARLIARTGRIARFDLAPAPPIRSPLREIDALTSSVEQMSRGLGSFRRYLPADLVQTLLAQGVIAELGGERRMLTVMFMDLEGFTATSERLGHRVVPLLAEYFSAMGAVIQATHGTIDKYIGDAVMAFWGAPTVNEEHATDACRAALACRERMRELQADWARRGLPVMSLRIGVSTGRIVVGNIGAPERLNYTVVGDPVNLASRLEDLNKAYETEVLISQQTYELARYEVVARRLDWTAIKGREEPVAVYELLALRDERGEAPGYEWVRMFERAVTLYDQRRWHEAAEQLRAVQELRPADPPTRIYLQRCEERIAAEPRSLALATSRATPGGE